MMSHLQLLLLFLSGIASISQSAGREAPSNHLPTPVKAVNLGAWLVTEGWITPNLFDEIPVNKDLLDGTQIQLKSVTNNNYLSADNGGGSTIVASKSSASGWETFNLWRITETTFQFRVFNWQFLGLDDGGRLVATSTSSDDSNASHTFELVRNQEDPNRIRIKAPNGSFLEVNSDEFLIADYPEKTDWGNDDPSVFLMTNVRQLQGEFQVTNGYGPDKAKSAMTNHWNSFIVEEDFKFISENGLTAVRIPVGWWIKYDENPPRPFVGGSLQALDRAFSWAEKYGIKVIIDLQAAPGSQNVWDHSGTRDGSQSWGQSDDTIDQTVEVIDFLTSRYANRSALYAMELLNEPLAPGVALDRLEKYYGAAYEAVRKHSDVYVMMSNRLGISDTTELLHFAGNFSRSVIDVHYYNVFSSIFQGMTVQQNIDYVKKYHAASIQSLTIPNGPLVFVGEWVDEMEMRGASKEDYQRFGAAQLEVYGKATFGWAYWTLKNVQTNWSLEWMIQNGYINL
ncbi:hypothetical protein KSP39_PZI010307 [Platanthera zijinensis]|uniref:Mannan endo-1,4-beta-mannosidase n=1 Tax=Platanthera zijinensis TaxID=2320716 RepID=A0AAP0BK68_9ASPA